MTPQEHLENFMMSPEIEKYEDMYEDMLEHDDFSHINSFFSGIEEEFAKDRPLFNPCKEQKDELERMRDIVFNLNSSVEDKKLIATALFDCLMVEKIKSYAMIFDSPAILADAMHDEYLKMIDIDDEDDEDIV